MREICYFFIDSMEKDNIDGDFNGDGITDVVDLYVLLEKWGMNVGFTNSLPPDPATVAPPIDNSGATNFHANTNFIYTGENPIQIEISEKTIDPKRSAILRGKVVDRVGDPISGAQISILSHPEYGFTLSRADGKYDLAVNGGGLLTVHIEKEDYLTSHRKVDVPWQDYAFLYRMLS